MPQHRPSLPLKIPPRLFPGLSGNPTGWKQEKNLARELTNLSTTPTECRQSSPSTLTIRTPKNNADHPCAVTAAVAAVMGAAEARRQMPQTKPLKQSLRNLLPSKLHLMQRAKSERPNSAATSFSGA